MSTRFHNIMATAFGLYWSTQRRKIGILPEHASEVVSSPEVPAHSAWARQTRHR
jgi:hypothetical protein